MNSDKSSSAFHGTDCTLYVGRIAWCARIPQTHQLCHLTQAFLPLPSLFRSAQKSSQVQKSSWKNLRVWANPFSVLLHPREK